MKKTKLTTALLSATLLAAPFAPAMAQDSGTTIRMGTEGAYPPYNFIDDNGQVAGFERELGDELCARAELTCEWVTNEWDSIIPNLVSGNYDTIIAGMSITDERDAVIDFTQDYYPPTESIYIAPSEDIDVTNAVVAAQTGTIQASHVAESGATLLEFATGDETIAAVRNGEADAVFADLDFLMPYTEDGDLFVVGEGVALGDGIGMGLRESDTQLKETFNAAITSMKEDGSLNELLIKYFGENTQIYE